MPKKSAYMQSSVEDVSAVRVLSAGVVLFGCELLVAHMVSEVIGRRNKPMYETKSEERARTGCQWLRSSTVSVMTLALVACMLWMARLRGVEWVDVQEEVDGNTKSVSEYDSESA